MAKPTSKSYCLRPMSMDDVPTIARWFEHLADLCLFDRGCAVPVNEATVTANWAEILKGPEPAKAYWYALEDDDGGVVGIVGLDNINYIHGDAIIAIYVSASLRREGIGGRAMAMVIDMAFNQLRLNRLTSYLRADNLSSQKLTESVGFYQEGLIRQGWFSGGKHFDIVAIGLLSEEWSQHRKTLAQKLDNSVEIRLGRALDAARKWPESLT
ncbi:MAG: GNAT family N-acetyltransferase [Rhodobacteraceae bacterium]|nr:GNAT family N-acetyltransferase [Paracoccaceae bacterium]